MNHKRSLEALRSELSIEERSERTLATAHKRRWALKQIPRETLGARESLPLLADISAVLREETTSDPNTVDHLFGIARVSEDIQWTAVRKLDTLDIEPLLKESKLPDEFFEIIANVAQVLAVNQQLPGSVERNLSVSRTTVGHPNEVNLRLSALLDRMLFFRSDKLVESQRVGLTALSRSVQTRIIACDDPDLVPRSDARVFGVLFTHGLCADQSTLVTQAVRTLSQSSDIVVRGWASYLSSVGIRSSVEDTTQNPSSVDIVPLTQIIHRILTENTTLTIQSNQEAIWMVGRAIAVTENEARHTELLQFLVELLSDNDLGVERPVVTTIIRLVKTGEITMEHLPTLFDGVLAALKRGVETSRRPAVRLIQQLGEADALTTTFVDDLLDDLVTDLRSGDDRSTQVALGALKRLFGDGRDPTTQRCPAVGEYATSGTIEAVLTAVTDILYAGAEAPRREAGQVLRELATAPVTSEPQVATIIEELVQTVRSDIPERRNGAAIAIWLLANRQVIDQNTAVRIFEAYDLVEFLESRPLLRAGEALLQRFGDALPIQATALISTINNKCTACDPDQISGYASTVETIARKIDLEPASELTLLCTLIDAHARAARDSQLSTWTTHALGGTIEAITLSDDPELIMPLRERLENNDPHVRTETLRALTYCFREPDSTGLAPPGVISFTPEERLLSEPHAQILIEPLLDPANCLVEESSLSFGPELLDTFLSNGWVTETQMEEIAALALEIYDEEPTQASQLLRHAPVVVRLDHNQRIAVFGHYCDAMRIQIQADTDSNILIRGSTPEGATAVLQTFITNHYISPAEFVEYFPISELNSEFEHSLRDYLQANTSTRDILLMLQAMSEQSPHSIAAIAPSLRQALAAEGIDGKERLLAIEVLLRLD